MCSKHETWCKVEACSNFERQPFHPQKEKCPACEATELSEKRKEAEARRQAKAEEEKKEKERRQAQSEKDKGTNPKPKWEKDSDGNKKQPKK